MKKIYSSPFGSDFINCLKDFILGCNRDISRVAVVFPGKRPSLYLKRRLAEHYKEAFYPPACFSIEEFIDYIARKKYHDYTDIEYADAVWLLYKSVQSLKVFEKHPLGNKRFGEFFFWGRYILDFINQLDTEDVHQSKLHSLENNAKIGYDIPENINELMMNISILRGAFHQLLRGERSFTRGFKQLCSLEVIEDADFNEFESICFAGFFAPGGVEKKLIRTICDRGKGEIILEGEPDEWPIMKQFVSYLGAEVERIGCETKASASMFIYTGFDTHAETMKVQEILKTINSKKTALVLPLSESLFPLLTFAVDRIDRAYNISIGYPFSRTSVSDLITGILDAQLAKRRNGLYSTEKYLQTILHPFIKNLDVPTDMRHLIFLVEKMLTGGIEDSISGKSFIFLEEVEAAIEMKEPAAGKALKVLKRLHSIFFQNIEKAGNLFEISEMLEKALQFILSNTPVRSYVLSEDIFRHLFESLEKFKHARFSREVLHPDSVENKRILCDFILHHLKSINLPFETKPIEDIEIIGVLESRNILFDVVVMLDVNEGIIPQPKKIDPLVPIGIYDMLGIPSNEFNEEIYRYNFYRLVRSAEEVHLLYIDADDKQRSRYIEQILWEQEKIKNQLNIIPIGHISYKINLSPPLSLPRVKKTDEVMQQLRNMVYSPSAIDNYIKCPLFFYYSNVLNFEEQRVVTDDIDAMDRGNLVHRILFETLRDFRHKTIDISHYNEILEKLDESIEACFHNRVVTGDYYLFKKLTKYKLKNFVRKNINNAPGPFIIQHLEETLRGTIDIDSTPIRLKGRIDRIDRFLLNNENMIIDYKTGSKSQYSNSILKKTDFSSVDEIHRHVKSFQLPIYVYLYHKAFSVTVRDINAKLALLKNNSEELLFLEKGSMDTDRAAVLNLYMDGLKTVLSDVLDSSKPFMPFDDDPCSSCAFNGLCRM